jgi:hypothetical protein
MLEQSLQKFLCFCYLNFECRRTDPMNALIENWGHTVLNMLIRNSFNQMVKKLTR